MSKALGKGYAWGLSGVLAAVLMVAPARAEVSADLSGTILVFPKVVWDGTRDTIIQIANTSNSMVHVRCFYTNARTRTGGPVSSSNPRICQLTDFELWLTKQQPTHWVVSQGRPVDPTDSFGEDGYGLDAGSVPPVPQGFEGELRCVQTDASGIPFAGNNLKGEAVLRSRNGDVSKYNAVAILASGLVSDDAAITLDNPLIPDITGEANSCHNALLLDHFVENPAGAQESDESPFVTTELTLVPCSADYENVIPSRVTVQFEITDEMEITFSASTTVDCWLNSTLRDISPIFTVVGTGGSVGTMFTKVKPVNLHGGVIGVAEETHRASTGANSARAAWNLQGDGQLADGANNFINGRFFPVSRYDATLNTPGGPVVDTLTIVDF